MHIDALSTFTGAPGTAQSLVGTGNIVSTDSMDVGAALRDLAVGDPLHVRIGIPTGVTGGTSVEFQIIGASDGALTSSVVVHGSTGPIPVAQLVAGAELYVSASTIGKNPRRYLGMRAVIVGTTTVGTWTASIVQSRYNHRVGGMFGTGYSLA